MKRLKLLWIAAIVLQAHSSSFAQVTVMASTTFITPITIVENVETGMVQTKTVSRGVSAKKAADAVSPVITATDAVAARFNVSGQDHYTYTITLPLSCTLIDAASHTMTVKGFTSNPVTGSIDPDGSQVLHVGATLHIPLGQAAGNYVSRSGVPVTVNYN